uniref:Uncharacterized protein n=1 Tax=Arundo donax TaxID=35708 RepID=A0A0A9HAC0_ARUDO
MHAGTSKESHVVIVKFPLVLQEFAQAMIMLQRLLFLACCDHSCNVSVQSSLIL